MYQAPYETPRASASINQVTWDKYIYRPRKAGRMVVRVLPAFGPEGEELPYADWSQADPGSSLGLGDQHFEPLCIVAWSDGRSHQLASMCLDDDGQAVRSPASVACARLQGLFKQAEAAAKTGCDVDPIFMPDKWGRPWISESSIHLVQAILVQMDGKEKKDPTTGHNPVVAIQLPWSAVKDLRGKLFRARSWDAETRATATDNRLGDYASSAGGHMLVIEADPSDDKKYTVDLASPAPLTVEQARTLFVPWGQLCRLPSVQESVDALRMILRDDMLGYALAGSQFERMLSSDTVQAGRELKVVRGAPTYQNEYERAQGYQTAPQVQRNAAPTMPGGFPSFSAPGAPARNAAPPRPAAPPPAAGWKPPAAPPPPFVMPIGEPSFPATGGDENQLPHLGEPPAAPPPALQRPPVSPMAPSAPVPPAPPSAEALHAAAQAGAAPAQPFKLNIG